MTEDVFYINKEAHSKIVRQMKSRQIAVLRVLGAYLVDNEGTVRVSTKELSRICGVTIRTIQRHVKSLLEFRTNEGEKVVERLGTNSFRLLPASGIVKSI